MIIYDYILWMWLKVECELEKNSLSNLICDLSFLKKHPPLLHIPSYPLMSFETLPVIISWVWIIRKMWNMNCKKNHSIILSLTCHDLGTFLSLIHIPSYPFVNFQNPMSYFFLVWVIHKRLNANWEKFHSIILSVTCHSLRNFSPIIHIPHIYLWIFETISFIISWVWVIYKI